MENDIDFMAHVDETTPPELVLKMLHAARNIRNMGTAWG
jgi:hypothetical protein